MLAESGLEALQLCPYFNVTGTETELAETLAQGRRYVEWARLLQCPHIRVFTGKVSETEATEAQFTQAVSGLRALCDLGPELQFVLETHRGSLMESSEGTLRLLQAVERPNLRVNLQVPMANGKETPETSASMLGKYTVHIHAHNWQGKERNLVCLSEGDYSFPAFLGVLRQAKFDGVISIEHGDHLGKADPWQVAAHEAAYLKALREELEK